MSILKKKARTFLEGLRFRFPLCCIIAHCLGSTGLKNGVVVRNWDDDVYVPCRLHQRKAISHLEYERRLNGDDFLKWYVPSKEQLFYHEKWLHSSVKQRAPKLRRFAGVDRHRVKPASTWELTPSLSGKARCLHRKAKNIEKLK